MGKKQYLRNCLLSFKLAFLSLYLFLTSRGKKRGNHRKAIFIHSLFRSGSTYLFKKYRETEGFWCYYEPFHHELVRLRKDNLDLFRYDNETTGRMNHPNLEKPHFFEYHVALDGSGLPFFYPLFAYDEFSSVRHQQVTYHYLLHLITRAPEGAVPLFQFNRSSLRIHWFKKTFPESLHVYLLRSPRDQFESYYRAGKYSDNIFLAINLYIIIKNYTSWFFYDVYQKVKDVIPISGDLNEDLSRCIYHINSFSLELHYTIFLHLWIASLVEGSRYADCIIDMNKLGRSEEYSRDISSLFSDNFRLPEVFLGDAKLKRYDSFILDPEQYAKIEHQLSIVYGEVLKEVDYKF